MPLTPFPVEEFGGLNLLADPTEVGMGGAVDLVNVDFDRPGRLRTRYGLSSVLAAPGTSSNGIAGFESGASTRQFVIGYFTGALNKLAGYQATGVLAASTTVAGSGFSAARFGDTSNERLYVTSGNDSIWRWDGTTFTQPAGMPSPAYLAIMPSSNRLVAALMITGSGTMGSAKLSRVAFSDPGAPETWTYSAGAPETGNFVDLTPGDGSAITGLVSWQNFLFAFKRDRFFVFTGESTKSDGTAQFNYRPVDGFGALATPVAGEEGVYFLDTQTVWLTRGGIPTRVGRPIESFLQGLTTVNGETVAASTGSGLTNAHLSYVNGRLYLTVFTVSGAGLTLVYNPKVDAWTAYSAAQGLITAVFGLRVPTTNEVAVGVMHSSSAVTRLSSANTTDAGTAITWSYQTGYSSAGGYYRQRIVSSGERKNHFKVDILGSGTVTHQVLTLNGRPNDVADVGGSVTLGTSPALARGSRRRGARGTHFAHKLSGSGQAVVSGMTYWLQGIEQDT